MENESEGRKSRAKRKREDCMLVLLAAWTSERLNGAQSIDLSHFFAVK